MIASFLEDFGPVAITADTQSDAETTAEDHRLAVFEQGYAAGWDDAIKAQAENTAIASEQFSMNLRDLSFTYHEVAQHISVALRPFLTALTENLVPASLDASVIAFIVEELHKAAALSARVDVHITCAPFRLPLLEAALPATPGMQVKILSDETFQKDELCIRFGQTEQRIDLSEITEQIRTSVDAFTFQAQKDLSHG